MVRWSWILILLSGGQAPDTGRQLALLTSQQVGGNGAPRAMPVSLTHARSQFDSVLLVSSPLPSHSSQ